MQRRSARAFLVLLAVLAATAVSGLPQPARAQPSTAQPATARPAGARPASVVSPVPQAGTPDISNGAVFAAAQVGATMVVGGSFTQTDSTNPSTPLSTPYVLAFNATTGAVQTSFAPALDGVVDTVLPGPTAGTVYVGGAFNNVRGLPAKGLVLLNLADGTRVTSFAMPTPDGTVQTVQQVGSRLVVGGTFTRLGGAPHGGLATVDASTGAIDPYLSSNVAVNHNWTPSSPRNAAKGAVGVFRVAVSPDGTLMVAIGNFKQVDGTTHDQIAMWNLPATGSATLRSWNTTRLAPACLAATFDSYVRDVAFSPDGSYFSLVNVGAYFAGALCDSASRWETAATGQDVQPTWVAYTGQDSLLSTAVTSSAVYVGGHQRWLNNGLGHDVPGPGAVPRPGVAALDPANGLPLAWNPGRNPRGAGAYTLYRTPSGLWMGSDTSYIGDGTAKVPDSRTYKRGRIAFFPLAGGQAPTAKTVATLPGEAYQGSVPAGAATGVLYRVDAGGPLLQSTDAGPDWTDDTASTSSYRNAGSTVTAYGTPVPAVDATVPAGTPAALFSGERVDPGAKGDGAEMTWHFPVPTGTSVDVHLYFAARCPCAQTVGSRVFDVSIDGATTLDHLDPVAVAGPGTGTMRSATVTSDGSVDIAFTHETGDPAVSGIELVRSGTGPYPTPAGALAGRTFSGTAAGAPQPLSTPLDVAAVRGATLVGGSLFYGKTDSELYRRTTDGRSWGPETLVDPYDDAYWSPIRTGSGGGVYRGTRPSFYDEITNLTSMAYDGTSRLYYTLYGQTGLYYRDFSPDSGIVGYDRHTVAATMPDVTGAFLAGGALYYATRADGNLTKVGFDGTGFTTSPTAVSGPTLDGIDWRTRVLYLGAVPPANQPPTAAFTASCSTTTCSFDGSGSHDADGAVSGWAWSYGDGTPQDSGSTTSHRYTQAGTYRVSLTVTDNDGATGTTSQQVVVQAPPASPIAFHGSSSLQSDTGTTLLVPVPSGTQTGDALLLKVSTNGTASSPTAPGGWAQLTQQVAGTALTVVWEHVATAADVPGSKVTVTLASPVKSSSLLLAYGGASPTSPVTSSAADTATTTSHQAPAVQVATAGSWVVHLWTDKSSGTTLWTPYAGADLRASAYGTGAGYLTAIATDDGVARAAGPAPAVTATTDVASRAAMFSVVLAPSTS